MFWGIKNHLRRTSLAKAKHSSNAGEPSRLIKQADSGLGDAAMALAAEADQAGDHVAAFTWYAMAAKTRNWLDDRSRVARLQWDRRRFQGLGVQVDHLALMHEWGQHHWPGYERELPLAWIQSRGPDSMRDLKQAWWWICLHEARWGSRTGDDGFIGPVAEFIEHVASKVSPAVRSRLKQQAEEQAHREFVEGK